MKKKKGDNPRLRHPKSGIQNKETGRLYVVATPIGHLEDITLRALKVLKSADMIAAENTIRTKGLCEHYGIRTRITAYHQHNQKSKTPGLIRHLKSGRDLAIVTDAGTPGISDPGSYLIRRAVEEGLAVTPIPGPSAVVAALSVSGMPTEAFVFCGFLPNRVGKRRQVLESLATEARTMVFFEAPHRITAMLHDVKEIFGDRQVVIFRELTKIFEEVKRGSVADILTDLTPDKIRGEFTLVVEGRRTHSEMDPLGEDVRDRMKGLLADRQMSVKDIASLLSKEEGVAYRQIYKECLTRKRDLERHDRHGAGQEV